MAPRLAADIFSVAPPPVGQLQQADLAPLQRRFQPNASLTEGRRSPESSTCRPQSRLLLGSDCVARRLERWTSDGSGAAGFVKFHQASQAAAAVRAFEPYRVLFTGNFLSEVDPPPPPSIEPARTNIFIAPILSDCAAHHHARRNSCREHC